MKPPDTTQGPVGAYLAEAGRRAADERASMGLAPSDAPSSADDVPRLLAVVEAVLAAHRPTQGSDGWARCAWCRDYSGERALWPCGEYLTIKAKLLREGGTGA